MGIEVCGIGTVGSTKERRNNAKFSRCIIWAHGSRGGWCRANSGTEQRLQSAFTALEEGLQQFQPGAFGSTGATGTTSQTSSNTLNVTG